MARGALLLASAGRFFVSYTAALLRLTREPPGFTLERVCVETEALKTELRTPTTHPPTAVEIRC